MILKLFDSLTPLDQLLLKCASVIGETVNRHMLESLMNLSATREIGLGKVSPCLTAPSPSLATCNLSLVTVFCYCYQLS